MYYRTRRIISNILSGVLAALIVIVGFFSIITISLNVVYIKTNVAGGSMLSTFNSNLTDEDLHEKKSGDTIYINRFKSYKVNDIIVAEYGDDYIIKRLVGCPGDTIQIKDEGDNYGLYVNNELLYSKEKTHGDGNRIGSSINYYTYEYANFLRNSNNVILNENNEPCIKLNEDEYFLMGDNWGKTSDSLTANGPFSKSEIVGKVDIVVPYGENEDGYILKTIFKMLFN